MCQAESTGNAANVNVKDLNLAGGSIIPMFDINVVSYSAYVNCCIAYNICA